MTPNDFKAWRAAMSYTQIQAAEALGISRESVGLYEVGRRRSAAGGAVSIPRTVELACAALAAGITGWAPGMGAGGGPATAR